MKRRFSVRERNLVAVALAGSFVISTAVPSLSGITGTEASTAESDPAATAVSDTPLRPAAFRIATSGSSGSEGSEGREGSESGESGEGSEGSEGSESSRSAG